MTKELFLTLAFASACNKGPSHEVNARAVADAVHAVLEADRATYAEMVVERLQNQEKVIKATEHFKDEKTLPLPAQMFRMGSERAQKHGSPVHYALVSQWAINGQNSPKTAAETDGLQAVADTPKTPFYRTEKLGAKTYLTAVYADVAVAPACVSCHNEHRDSPKKDFKLGDVMGGVVVRVALP
jgi:hypothetical protein